MNAKTIHIFAFVALLLASAVSNLSAQTLTPIQVGQRGKASTAFIQSSRTIGRGFGAVGNIRGGAAAGLRGFRGAGARGLRGAAGGFRGAGVRGGARGFAGFSSRNIYSSAAAFCVHKNGLYVTTYQSVAQVRNASSLRMVVNSGGKNQKDVTANVVRTDVKANLALLWITANVSHRTVQIGSKKDVANAVNVVACGFPAVRGIRATTPPNIVVKRGQVVRSADPKAENFKIRMKMPVEGGPVLDEQGKLVAMISGTDQDGMLTIPSTTITNFLRKPAIVLSPPAIDWKKRREPHLFQAHVTDVLGNGAEASDVELVVIGADGKARPYAMKAKDGVYQAMVKPDSQPKSARRVTVNMSFGDAAISGVASDQEVKIGKQKFRLSAAQRIVVNDDNAEVLLTDGKTLKGDASKLPVLKTSVGGEVWDLPLRQVQSATVSTMRESLAFTCTVIVKRKGVEVARTRTRLSVEPPNTNSPTTPNRTESAVMKARIDQYFQRYDKNRNGRLEAQEAPAAMMRSVDRNNDGHITRLELFDYFSSRTRSRFGAGGLGGGAGFRN